MQVKFLLQKSKKYYEQENLLKTLHDFTFIFLSLIKQQQQRQNKTERERWASRWNSIILLPNSTCWAPKMKFYLLQTQTNTPTRTHSKEMTLKVENVLRTWSQLQYTLIKLYWRLLSPNKLKSLQANRIHVNITQFQKSKSWVPENQSIFKDFSTWDVAFHRKIK